eukprot:9481120-Pyramimonas_sp.AAC.1
MQPFTGAVSYSPIWQGAFAKPAMSLFPQARAAELEVFTHRSVILLVYEYSSLTKIVPFLDVTKSLVTVIFRALLTPLCGTIAAARALLRNVNTPAISRGKLDANS